jgi:predicted permease
MTDFFQDLRFGARQLWTHPGFTIAAVLCIALGIGANSATFSFANALLFKLPNVEEPERLVRLFVNWTSGLKFGSFSYPDYVDFRDRNDVFTDLAAESLRPLHLSTGRQNEKVAGSVVSGNYFSVLGIEMVLGRAFFPEEDETPGTHPVAVLSHGLWERRFGAEPNVVGETVLINGQSYTVIGVAPKGFYGTNVAIRSDIWVPILMQEQLIPGEDLLDRRGFHWLQFIIGRLKPGVTVEQARASTNALMANLIAEYPDSNTGKSIDVYPEAQASLHPMIRQGFVGFMSLIFGVVGFVLLLACANVAGLLLARMAARHREVGIRLALGAGRRRIVRQLLSESLLLSFFAGGLGLLLAYWLIRLMQSFQPPTDFPIHFDIGIDPMVLGFTFLVAFIAGIIFGLAPALQATKHDLVSSLKEGTTSQVGRASLLRRFLVIGQVAVSLFLLIGAGLLVRGLQSAQDLDVGFDPDHQLIAVVELGLQGYNETQGRQFRQSLRERVAALPGVQSVGFGVDIPLHMSGRQNGVLPEGFEVPEGSDRPSIDLNFVDHGYFQAMGIPILRGRGFELADDEDAPPVIIINEAFAERFWPGEDPIGKQVRTSGEDHTVIGVVPTGKYFSLGEDPKPFFYHTLGRYYHGTSTLHVRTAGDPNGLLEAVRREVRELDATLPISDLKTMHAALGFAFLSARMGAGVVGAFAVLALLLAAVGLYGVIAYSVSQGSRDIGIRMALGARSRDVLGLVLGKGMKLTAAGLVIGLVLGLALTRLMGSFLYGTSTTDPVSYISGCVLLAGVAFMASFLPARRATKLDPVVVLRDE